MKQQQKLLFIINPNAGKAKIKNKALEIIDTFVKAGYETQVYTTQAHLDAYQKVLAQGSQYDLVVCGGGDGTLNETVSALLQLPQPPTLGYIPAGTTNDFASGLKIPKFMLDAAEVVVNGRLYHCDVGAFNEQYFTYVAAFGAITEVTYETPQKTKNAVGYFAYILEAIKKIHEKKSFHLQIQYDEGVLEDEFVYGIVSNSDFVAGFKNPFSKNVAMNDGMFEVILVRKPKNLAALPKAISSTFQEGIDNGLITMFKTRELHITPAEAAPTMQWTLDGEYGGAPGHVYIHNLQQALPIMVSKFSLL